MKNPFLTRMADLNLGHSQDFSKFDMTKMYYQILTSLQSKLSRHLTAFAAPTPPKGYLNGIIYQLVW